MRQRFDPIWFGGSGYNLCGWLHRPRQGGSSGTGILFCNPLGYEEICAHRAIRDLAEACAGQGFPALRFDYAGTGDSAGDATDPRQVEGWLASIEIAGRTLRAETGATQIVLAGLRIGATLAALCASEEVQGIIAMAPVIRPRAYLRELRTLQAAGSPGMSGNAGGLEAGGFQFSEETLKSLGAIDLCKVVIRESKRVLILDRDDLPGARDWVDWLGSQGHEVEQQRFAGYSSWMSSPHESVVPGQLLPAVLTWLGQWQDQRQTPASTCPAPMRPAESNSTCWVQSGTPIRESIVHLDPEKRLVGVVTEAVEPRVDLTGCPRRAILLLNAGATHRIGPGRMSTDFARRAAVEGFVSLRMDLAGIGDSVAASGDPDNVVYARSAVRDIASAVEALRNRYRIDEIVLIGLCSGAYHALKAASSGAAVAMIVMLNPLTFRWNEGMTLGEQLAPHRVVQDVNRYRQNLLRPETWVKALRGRIDLIAVLRRLTIHARDMSLAGARYLAGMAGFSGFAGDLGTQLESIAGRGVRMTFIFSQGEPGIDLLQAEAGHSVKKLMAGDRLHIEHIPGGDHTFTARAAREVLFQKLFNQIIRPAAC